MPLGLRGTIFSDARSQWLREPKVAWLHAVKHGGEL